MWQMCSPLHGCVRHPVLLRAAAGQRHADLPEPGRQPGNRSAALAGRSHHRPDRSATGGLLLGPHLDPDRSAPTLFPVGAALAAAMLVAMPNAATLWVAVLAVWMLDASVNFTMGPFRAFVADQLSPQQRATGFIDLHVLCEPGRGGRKPAALGVRATGRHVDRHPPARSATSVKYAFYVGAHVADGGGVLVRAARPANFPPRCSRNSTSPRREPHRSRVFRQSMRRHAACMARIGCAGFPRGRVRRERSPAALRADVCLRSPTACSCSWPAA